MTFEGKGSAKALQVCAGHRHRVTFAAPGMCFDTAEAKERTSHFSTRLHRP
jgi:hypothetical protein